MMPTRLAAMVDKQNFDEVSYLSYNPDVAEAVSSGEFDSGWAHFCQHGQHESRLMLNMAADIEAARAIKMRRIIPLLRSDMPCIWENNKPNFLTDKIREETRIISTKAVSSNGYDQHGLDLINDCKDGLVLDCGAGSRPVYFDNVVNYEIVDYPSTDVLGVGEGLPFLDDSFDGVLSVAVLEHVRDPFTCAREISRVLKPGGKLYCGIPFLQPYHGYPHHYFNATPQGARRLFEDFLEVESVTVIDSTHPIWALQWILASWLNDLPAAVRKDFSKMTVKQLLRSPLEQVGMPFCRMLSPEKQLELACATVLMARKLGP